MACAGSPSAAGGPSPAGCTELGWDPPTPLSTCCTHPIANTSLCTSERKFCSWNRLGFSHSAPGWSQMPLPGGAASSSAPCRAWELSVFWEAPQGHPQIFRSPCLGHPGHPPPLVLPPVLPRPLSVHLGCPMCLTVPVGAVWGLLGASQDTPGSSWCLSGHPRSHHWPFGAALESLCAFQFVPWAFWCPQHPLTAFSDPSSLGAFSCALRTPWLGVSCTQMSRLASVSWQALFCLLVYPRALHVPFGAPKDLWVVWSIPKPSWGCQTTPGLSVCCPRTGLAAESFFG